MLLRRVLLTRNIEMYELKKELYGDIFFYMLLLDYRRPSQYNDFSFIKGFEEEDFSSRENYIQAVILYKDHITDSEKELTYEIASGFLEDKDDCDWSMKYIKADFKDLQAIGVNHAILLQKITPFLEQVDFPNKISDLNSDSFKYLMQD